MHLMLVVPGVSIGKPLPPQVGQAEHLSGATTGFRRNYVRSTSIHSRFPSAKRKLWVVRWSFLILPPFRDCQGVPPPSWMKALAGASMLTRQEIYTCVATHSCISDDSASELTGTVESIAALDNALPHRSPEAWIYGLLNALMLDPVLIHNALWSSLLAS